MDIVVHHAELVEQGGDTRFWMVTTEVGGELIPHAFPEDTLEWRAAEYGIDPADMETLLEVVLYEPHLTHDPYDPDLLDVAETVDKARTHHLARIGQLRGTGRVRAATRVEILDARRRAVAAVRSAGRDPDVDLRGAAGTPLRAAGHKARVLLESGTEDPLAVLRREIPIDPDVVAVKAEHVGRVRESARTTLVAREQARTASTASGLTGPASRPRPSVEDVRRRLLGHQAP